MNPGDIAERLIQAAEIEEASARHMYGPKKAKSLALPYSHTQAEMNGWGTERLAEERKEFWESLANRPTARQISEAEEAWSWYALVENEDQRSALAAWVRCMANSREHFQDWCFENGIHPETGRRRKDRALARISAHLSRSVVQNNDIGGFGVLPDTPEISDVEATFEAMAPKQNGLRSWASDTAFTSIFSDAPADFSWAQKRNEMRRQREARKRKAA